MDSRKPSEGNISPTAMSNDRDSRSTVTTPTTPYTPSWDGPARIPGIGFNGDPFAGMPGSASLRGSASSFQPGSSNGDAALNNRMRFLSMNSTGDDDDQPIIVSSTPATAKHAVQNPIGTKSTSTNSSPVHPRQWFTTDVDPEKPRRDGLTGRFISIVGVNKAGMDAGVIAFLEKQYGPEIRGKKFLNTSEHGEYTDVVLYINDTRVAEDIHTNLQSDGQITAKFVTYDWYDNGKAARDRVDPQTTYVGQVTFIAEFKGRTADFDMNNIDVYNKVRALATSCGEILAFEQNRSAQYPLWQFRVEYYKVSDAMRAIEKAGAGMKLGDGSGWVVFAHQYAPPTHGPYAPRKPVEQHAVQPVLAPPPDAVITTSPTGRTAWWTDNDGVTHSVPPPHSVANVQRHNQQLMLMRDDRHVFASPYHATPAPSRAMVPYMGHGHNDSVVNGEELALWKGKTAHGHPQNIDIGRIMAGLDVRTTIMMRNVPNVWTRAMLKNKIDRICGGRYNFMYLRIDFKENKNIGYAFVNFENALDIVAFVENFVGKPWEGGPLHWSKPKMVETSYATIQGLDSLIDKFRNSSIMDENMEYRPALYQTPEEKAKDEREASRLQAQGIAPRPIPEICEQKEFPPPNNRAKKERSTANAGQIGLFSPRNGRYNSDRFYRSQYDRGTPAQIMEDVAYYPPIAHGMHGPLRSPGYPPNMRMVGSPVSWGPFNAAAAPGWSPGRPWLNSPMPYGAPGMPSPGPQDGRRPGSRGSGNGTGSPYTNGHFGHPGRGNDY